MLTPSSINHIDYFDTFIRQYKVQPPCVIINKVGLNCIVKFKEENPKGSFQNHFMNIPKGGRLVVGEPYLSNVIQIRVESESSEVVFLNPAITNHTGFVRLEIDRIAKIAFPILDPNFSFVPLIPQVGQRYSPLYLDFFVKHKTLFFDSLIEENISEEDFFVQRDRLYHMHQEVLGQLVVHSINRTLPATKPKIPLIFHFIWLTDLEKPEEPDDIAFQWVSSFKSLHPEWKYFIWIQDVVALPKIKQFCNQNKAHGFEIKLVSDWSHYFESNLQKEFETSLQEKKFGHSSDILRYKILHRFGGLYLDWDVENFHCLTPINHLFDFYVGAEPYAFYTGNAVIGSIPGHPILEKVLELVERNCAPAQTPNYVKNDQSIGKTVTETGPHPLSIAFYLAADGNVRKDIIFPPFAFYPTVDDRYLSEASIKPNSQRQYISGWVAHYWQNTWIPGSKRNLGGKG